MSLLLLKVEQMIYFLALVAEHEADIIGFSSFLIRQVTFQVHIARPFVDQIIIC